MRAHCDDDDDDNDSNNIYFCYYYNIIIMYISKNAVSTYMSISISNPLPTHYTGHCSCKSYLKLFNSPLIVP